MMRNTRLDDRLNDGRDQPLPPGGCDVVRVCEVTKTFVLGSRRVEALRGVNLNIDQPGFYAIMGPSGSGKSTLLHLIAALDRPDAGTIHVADHDLTTMDERALTLFRRHQIGIVFQQFNLIPTLTAFENVTLPAMLDSMSKTARDELGRHWLDELGLTDRAEHRPDALSGGEQQRVAIARALMFNPRVLLADEPTGNLDSTISEQIWTLLGELADRKNMTVVMVTHEAAAARHCRQVFVLRDGRVQHEFNVDGSDAAELATRIQFADR